MDSQVSLALMTKAKLVFESEDTFLAFPVTPYAYSREDLDFDSGDPARDVVRLCEFSLLVDRIPSGTLWSPVEDRRLSEFYAELLRGATRLASATRTPADDAAYQAAWKFLNTEDGDGIARESAVVAAYNQCRDAYLTALEDYKNAHVSAQLASDAAVRQRWKDVDEPPLRARVSAAEQRWNREGRRSEVDAARRVVSTLGAKSAQLTWDQWASRFNPSIDLETEPASRQTFAPSAFSPVNALDTGSWQHFNLLGSEVDALARQAPPELRARLGDDAVDLDVESVSFEYSSAGVNRPWFVSDVFRSRFWKFDDPTRVASDGANPPHGLCPAYVAGIVFARQLEVKPRLDSARNREVLTRFQRGDELTFAGFGKLATPAVKPGAAAMTLRAAPAPRSARTEAPAMAMRVAPAVSPQMMVAASRVRDHRSNPPPPVAARPVAAPVRSRVLLQQDFKRVPAETATAVGPRPGPLPLPPPPTPIVPTPTPPPVVDDSITILAFICKRVPKSPDPDPSLQWG
jgi:hypothetical protein